MTQTTYIYCPAVLGGCGGKAKIRLGDELCAECMKLIEQGLK